VDGEPCESFYPALVDEVIPKPVSVQQLTEILQKAGGGGVPIRDLKSILQALSEAGALNRIRHRAPNTSALLSVKSSASISPAAARRCSSTSWTRR